MVGAFLTLRDLGLEHFARVGIDGEGGGLVHFKTADVGLVHVGIDLHIGQVGNGKGWGLEAGGHGLAYVDIAGDNGAIDRERMVV